MKKEEEKPFPFAATDKPFEVRIEPKMGTTVTGVSDGDYWMGFTKPVVVKKGDIFSYDQKKGFFLNGKIHPVNMRPRKKTAVKMGWAPKRLRLAVFFYRDKIWCPGRKDHGKRVDGWFAVDTRGYWLAQGKTALDAIKSVIYQLRATELMDREERKRGRQVIRWHVERRPGVRKELLEMEEKAKKTGFILEGVDWRKSFAGLPKGF